MALINIREVLPDVHLGLWEMEAAVSDLLAAHPELQLYADYANEHFKSESRRMEFLCVRALLHEMMLLQGVPFERVGHISHAPSGKPQLRGWHISVSHTHGYVALMLSRVQEVAVDIEYVSERVCKVASKFMRKDEHASDLIDLLVHWCAKETVYKLFSEDDLQSRQIRVKPFDQMGDWACEVENLKSGKTVRVDFELTMEFVLTYATI